MSPQIRGRPCWRQTLCTSYPCRGDHGQRMAEVTGVVKVNAPPRAYTNIKPKHCFLLFTVVSNVYRGCYREFQTEYLLCDCNILWMHRWVKERNITVRDTRCVYPKSLQAQPVTGVKQELLTCGKRERTQRAFPVTSLPPRFP